VSKPALISLVSLGVIVAALAYGATSAFAQYPAYERGRVGDRGTLDDFFDRMGRNNPNPTLTCNTYKRLNREGEIVWLRLECRA
jgi:hypothetical protein